MQSTNSCTASRDRFRLRRKAQTVVLVSAIFLFSRASESAAPADMPVPLETQALIFKKIFSYRTQLADKSSPTVYLVYDEVPPSYTDEIASAFDKANLEFASLGVDQLEAIQVPAVIYFTSDTDSEAVRSFCASKEILSISGDPILALAGKVSIALAEVNRRPKIVVHMQRLATEGQELSSDLLNLARVVGREN